MATAAFALALVPLSFNAERHLETAMQMEGSEAQAVADELSKEFRSPFVHRVMLVIQGIPEADSEGGKAALRDITDALRKEPGVTGVLSCLDWVDPIFLGRGGGTFVVVGLDPGTVPVETLIPRLRLSSIQLQAQLQSRYPAAKMRWTGETPLNFDLRKASSDDVRSAELRILPITLLLLLAAFGSLVAALLPLSVGWLAISMTMGCVALLARPCHLSILVQNVATMLGLGLGIDYALLMVSRFREGLNDGRDPAGASEAAARDAGHTLIVSAATVAIGFAALSTVPVSELRSIGIAGFLVTGASLLLSTTLLPVLLGVVGTRIEAGRLPMLKARSPAAAAASRNRWRAWGLRVSAHPWKSLVLAGAPLLLLASQAFRLETGIPTGHWLPENAESVHALHSLEDMGRAGLVQSLRVVLEFPPGTTVSAEAGWQALDRLSQRLAADHRAERVLSLPALLGQGRGPVFLSFLPESTRRSFMRADGRAALLEVLPASNVTPSQQEEWVRELRRAGAPKLSGLPGAALRIGGIPALNADYEAIVGGRMLPVMALVVGGTVLALLLGFRAVVVAVKAVALNLLSVGAAFGALVLVFQDGHGGALVGAAGGTGTVFPIVPILVFAVVFGLSMDYEIFLVARVREARRSGLSETAAIAEGLATTGGLVTSAATIMVAVFGAFVFGNFLLVKMLGFTLAFAVLLDAALVRTIIGPALLRLAGDWNWWPWGLVGPRTKAGAAADHSSYEQPGGAPLR
jgi:RND superfamily putative drug exporter